MRAAVLTILISTLLCIQLPPPASAQLPVTDNIYTFCNQATFTPNDNFGKNLNAVVDLLRQNSSRVLYSLATSETHGTPSDYVYGMYQCRGDIPLSDCSICVINAFNEFNTSKTCGADGNSKGVRAQYRGCYVRYENFIYSTSLDTVLVGESCSGSAEEESSQIYRQNLGTALRESAAAAPQHLLFGYNATSVGSGSSTAYALTQCVGYLNSTQCADCLSQVSNYSDICNGSVSGEIYYVDCYYLFGNSSLVFTTDNNVVPPPSLSPVPPPSLSPAIPPPLQSPVILPAPSLPPATIPSPVSEGARSRAKNHGMAAIVGIGMGILVFLAFI